MSNTQQKQPVRSPPMLPLNKPFNLALVNFINRQNVPEIGAQIKKITHVFYDPLLIQTPHNLITIDGLAPGNVLYNDIEWDDEGVPYLVTRAPPTTQVDAVFWDDTGKMYSNE